MVRKIQQQMGWPWLTTFKSYIADNLIRNCVTTIDNIKRSQQIYGTTIPILKRKMTKKYNLEKHAETILLPLHIAKQHKDIQL